MIPPDPAAADARVVMMLTTEHFALQGARSATTAESTGRATIYLTFISSTLVALSLLGTATRLGTPFIVTGLVLAPTLVFLGIVTFVRMLDASYENTLYAYGINRLRRAYFDIAPEWQTYFIQQARDDMPAVLYNEGITSGPFQMYFSASSAVGVINSVVVGSFVGGLGAALHLGVLWTLLLGVATFIASVAAHMRYSARAWFNFARRYPPLFPSQKGTQ